MKLSHYARSVGVTYRTAFRWWQNGQIKGYQLPSGTIVVTEVDEDPRASRKGWLPFTHGFPLMSIGRTWNGKPDAWKTTVQRKAIGLIRWSKTLAPGCMIIERNSWHC